LTQENQNLAKYQHIIDVEAEVQSMRGAIARQMAAAEHQTSTIVGEQAKPHKFGQVEFRGVKWTKPRSG
jgi:hypothetical protein